MSTVTSPNARLKPASTIALKIHVAHLPFVVFSLLDDEGEPMTFPSSLKPASGMRVADVLLLCDDKGKLELANIRALPTTLLLVPRDGTERESRALPKAATGSKIALKLQDLHKGVRIPLDLPGARAEKVFELSIEPEVAHVHRCC